VKEKPTVGSPFCEAVPSYCIPEAPKDVNVYFLFTFLKEFSLMQEYL
jgi:hypothetical protein